MPDLLTRRLLITTGKGGVGKTTVSAALARIAARRGLRALLVSIERHDRFGELFGVDPVGATVTELGEGIAAVNLEPDRVIEEFFDTHVGLRAVSRKILAHPVWKSFYAAAPGLRELVLLGKIFRLVDESSFWSGKPTWDVVIFDAPSTGHGAGILNVPDVSARLLVGNLRHQAEKIAALLRDRKKTALNLVTLPEEMPVAETIELHARVRDELRIPMGRLFVNAVPVEPFEPDDDDALSRLQTDDRRGLALDAALGGRGAGPLVLAAARHLRARRDLACDQADRVRAAIPLPSTSIPLVATPHFDRAALDAVADAVEAGLRAGVGARS